MLASSRLRRSSRTAISFWITWARPLLPTDLAASRRLIELENAITARALARLGSDRGRAAGYLLDELAQDRLGEAVVALGNQHKGRGAADHIAAVVVVEPGFFAEDREPVDRDPPPDQRVARFHRRGPEISHAVAGNVDDPMRRRIGHAVESGAGGQ